MIVNVGNVDRGVRLAVGVVLIALALLGILLYYIVVALEKTFADWADRSNL